MIIVSLEVKVSSVEKKNHAAEKCQNVETSKEAREMQRRQTSKVARER